MPKKKNKDELSDKDILFANEYVANNFIGYKAVRLIAPNAKIDSLYSMATQYLAKPAVKKLIEQLKEERLYDAEIRQDDIIRELKVMAFANLSDYLEVKQFIDTKLREGNTELVEENHQNLVIKDFDNVDKRKLAALSEVRGTINKDGANISVKLGDKLGALRELKGWFNGNEDKESTDVNVNVSLNLEKGAISLKRRKKK